MSEDDAKRKRDETHSKLVEKFMSSFDPSRLQGGAGPSSTMDPEQARASREAIGEALKHTTAETSEDVILRAIMLYSAVVKHVKSGGKVQFVDAKAVVRTLKVPMKPNPS